MLFVAIADSSSSASAISPGDWRSQRIAVQAIDEDAPLSTSTLATGLTGQSVKSMPSPYVPRMNSVVFHPLEMLYAAGEPDGSGKSRFLAARFALLMKKLFFSSANHGVQSCE